MGKKKFKKKCEECGKEFVSMNVRKIYCSNACKSANHAKKNKKEYLHKCLMCENDFVSNSKITKFCSFSCAGRHKNLIGIGEHGFCRNCNKKFSKKHSKHFFCSDKCKSSYGNSHAKKELRACSYCGKKFERSVRAHKNKNTFCSKDCESNFREQESKDVRTCEYCQKRFSCKKGDGLRFCSVSCQNKWQSETRVRENSPNYKKSFPESKRIKECEECGKKIRIKPYQENSKRFCSRKCQSDYSSRMSDEKKTCPGCKKEFDTKRYLKRKYCSRKCSLKYQSNTMTRPHLKTVAILKTNRIWHRNEYATGRYLLDVFLGKGLGIEVMGRYWHGDIRIYPTSKNNIQRRADKKDKRKKLFLEKEGITVLYIWEDDIEKLPEMCEKLILRFVERNGKLLNYHSMNYKIDRGRLVLNRERLVPRFEK